MKRHVLLDTQAFIAAILDSGDLSSKARSVLQHTDNIPFLSHVSIWEIQIKLTIQKLKLPASLPVAVQRAVTEIGLELLPIAMEHLYKLSELPLHHRDPFDRLLIAQASYEQMTILGNDAAFDAYGITRIW